MSIKGRPITAKARENIREGQLKRWQRIREMMAKGEQHEAECHDDQHHIDAVHPRGCEHHKQPIAEKVAEAIIDFASLITGGKQ